MGGQTVNFFTISDLGISSLSLWELVFVVYLQTIQAGSQWKTQSLFDNCLISVPVLRKFCVRHFHNRDGKTHLFTYLEITKDGCLLWTKGEPLMIGQHLVMHKKKSLPAIFVRIIFKLVLVVICCSLIFVCNQT
jgi:hypothetical protein